jgi:hypothetical protein
MNFRANDFETIALKQILGDMNVFNTMHCISLIFFTGICVIGNFENRKPNEAALNAIKQLIACGFHNGKLSPVYSLLGHRDVRSTSCPGQSFYNLIQKWPHYNVNHLKEMGS